jgi:AcrR family transcriptional regulator
MAPRKASTLTRDDWADAALEAIGRGGLAAVAVEPLAAHLGATKGSFYWHFRNRAALVEAALQRWESAHTEAVIAMVEEEEDGLARLRLLFRTVFEHSDDPIEVAMLATADHPVVAPVLSRVTARRMSYTVGLFAALGFGDEEARDRGQLAIAAYLGHVQLAHATPQLVERSAEDATAYADLVVAVLTADLPGSPAPGGRRHGRGAVGAVEPDVGSANRPTHPR